MTALEPPATGRLVELIRQSEDWLMERVLGYARERGYARYTSTLVEAWRLSIAGLSASLIEGFEQSTGSLELGPDEDYAGDPMTRFGVIEAQRHRQRGVSLTMFLGLMKYYRQGYLDLVAEKVPCREDAHRYARYIERGFDRIEIAFCHEWAQHGETHLVKELQAANRAMTNEKNAYLTAFESLADPVLMIGEGRRILNLNHAAARLIDPAVVSGAPYYGSRECDSSPGGTPNEAFVGKDVLDLFPWLSSVIADRQDSGSGEATREVETTLRGQRRCFEVKSANMLDVSGKFRAALLTLRDITGREEAENALRLQSSALSAAANGIVITDREGRITWVNPAFTRLTGYTYDEAVGQNPRVLKSGQHAPEFYRELWETIRSGRIWQGEMINRRKDGSLYTEEMTITPVPGEHGEVTHFVAIKQDVTARKRAEQAAQDAKRALETTVAELGRANDELARRNAELDEFSYAASHDLQEPLRKLNAFSMLLEKDLGPHLPERAAKDLGFITDAARRMQTLIQDLLHLSRAGRAAIRRERVPLGFCADEALDAISARIEETDAVVTRDELPDVWGDATMLTQLYQNLIGNALKYVAPGRRPEVRLTAERIDGEWVFGVRDNGIGIEPRYAEQIFAPFKRLHGHEEYEGNGIGLAICRKTVHRHGGDLWVESQPGEGSHFRFTLGVRLKGRRSGVERAAGTTPETEPCESEWAAQSVR